VNTDTIQPEKRVAFPPTHYRGLFSSVGRSTLPWRAVALAQAATIVIDLGSHFLSFSLIMRLLVEILIVAAVIYFGWNKPFKEYATKAKTTITTKLDGLGGTLQKHQDSSVKRY
jgi:hypothetical protein